MYESEKQDRNPPLNAPSPRVENKTSNQAAFKERHLMHRIFIYDNFLCFEREWKTSLQAKVYRLVIENFWVRFEMF